jgi:type II secretory pathway pseudopilin PulG
MLIVIVIIGILIAALLPRMQAAQWRARDVARKTALSQIQSAIVTHQWDNWSWPWSWSLDTNGKNEAKWIDEIHEDLINAWMSDVPKDPLGDNTVTGLWSKESTSWNFLYMVSTRNWSKNAWFVLMARTEVAWWSNWVVCSGTATTDEKVTDGNIGKWTDLSSIQICSTITKGTCSNSGSWTCSYANEDQLRYIVLY